MDLSEYKERRNRLAVIVFFTAKWCKPCKSLYPIFEKLKKEAPKNLDLIKIDVDESEDVAAYCEIESMPTFRFYFEGQLIGSFSGADPNKLQLGYNNLVNKLKSK